MNPFPALGFDPAPGSPSAVDALVDGCARTGRELTGARDAVLRSGRGAGSWEGPAADGFRSGTAELPGRLDTVVRSAESAGAALRLWRADLVVMQRSAQRLEAEAVTALDRLAAAAAHPDLALAGRRYTGAAELAAAEQRIAAAKLVVQARQVDLDDVRRRAEQLRAQHTELGADLTRALVRARDLVPAPEWWIGDLADDPAAPLRSASVWLTENANTIAALADVTGDLSTMVGLAGAGLDLSVVGAPAGATAGAVSGALSGVALVGHIAASAGGADVPWETLVWDAVGVATLGLSRVSTAAADQTPLAATVPLTAQSVHERATDGRAASFFDNVEKYWVPRDPLQAWQYGSSGAGGLAVPFTNAWNDGRAADERAARERAGR